MDLQNDFCFETNVRISAYMCGAKKFKSSPHQGEIHWPLWDTTRFPLHLGDSWIMLASQKLSLFILHFCITIIIIQKEPHCLIKVKVPNSRYCCSLCGRRWKGKGEFGRARGKGKETSFPSRARPNSPFPFPSQRRPCRLILLPQETRRDSW